MGASGRGKTTLLHVLAGLKVPTSGVWLGDREITRLGESARAKLRRTEVGVVFQEFNLVPVLNVRGQPAASDAPGTQEGGSRTLR